MNRRKNLRTIFHMFIISMFVLSFGGCGYKAAPYYEEIVPVGDENIEFIVKEPSR